MAARFRIGTKTIGLPADHRAGRPSMSLGARARPPAAAAASGAEPPFRRQLRDGKARAAPPGVQRLERAANWADALLQHEITPGAGAIGEREQHRGPHGGMPGERQLPRRGENAQPRAVPRIGRREHKDGLGMAEFARDRLHGVPLEPFRLQHHRERIAGKAPVGEHVERREPSAHWTSMRDRSAFSRILSIAHGLVMPGLDPGIHAEPRYRGSISALER
jgi:hypothetical protein